jgi:hypothetical protein
MHLQVQYWIGKWISKMRVVVARQLSQILEWLINQKVCVHSFSTKYLFS